MDFFRVFKFLWVCFISWYIGFGCSLLIHKQGTSTTPWIVSILAASLLPILLQTLWEYAQDRRCHKCTSYKNMTLLEGGKEGYSQEKCSFFNRPTVAFFHCMAWEKRKKGNAPPLTEVNQIKEKGELL